MIVKQREGDWRALRVRHHAFPFCAFHFDLPVEGSFSSSIRKEALDMNPRELYQAGRLSDAIKALSAELRDNPTDVKRRTFLFELLCFAGEYERADKQLEVLAQAGPQSEMGVLLYRSALFAERQRQDVFERGEFPSAQSADDDSPSRGG